MKKTTVETPLTPELTEEQAKHDLAVRNTAAAIDQAVMDAEPLQEALGIIKTATFYQKISDVLIAQSFQEIKKTKGYRNYPYVDADGKRRQIVDLEEFCQVKFGKSARRVRELAQNLHLLGSDLYKSAEQIGFRARDYRALKALPPEEQEVVKQALASESRDEVIDILQDMAARHQTEKEAARKEKENLTADLEARSTLLEHKAEKLEQTEQELYKLKSLPKDADLELKLAREEEAVERLHLEHVTFLSSSKVFLEAVAAILSADDVSAHTKEHAVWEVRQVCEHFNRFLIDHGILVDFTEIVYPEWRRDTAQADLEQGNTEEPSGAGVWN